MWIGINFVITVVGRGFISWQGHLGGFLGGLVLGVLLSLAPKMAHKLYANLACGVAFAILVIVPWWLALWGAGR